MIKIVQVCGGMRLFPQSLYKYSKSVQLKSSETFGEGFYSQ